MFFNPAQSQSQMSNPLFQQMMSQMQGGGMMQQPAQQQMMNMAPQLPMAQSHAPGSAPQGPTPPQQGGGQSGFFGQMLQSPQNMQSGLGSLGQLYGMGSGAMSGLSSAGSAVPYALNNMGMGNTAYSMLDAADGAAGAAGAMNAGSAAAASSPDWISALMAFL